MYSVLQVTPALDAGGVERTTIEMAEAITRAGGLALVASAGGRLERELEAAGGELVRLPVDSKNPITVALNAGRLARAAKARNINVIHARSRAPAWSAWMAARRLKLPFVTTFHGIYNGRTALKRFYNSIMAKGDLVIANSEYTRAHVMQQYKLPADRVVAIPRGVDVDQFDPDKVTPSEIAAMRASWGLTPNDARFVLILPARLTRWKGQRVLIDAMARVNANRPGAVKAILAGDAQGRRGYEQELKATIMALGLRDDVAIVGHIGQMNVALAAADAVAVPSVEPEAFGRSAVEAQAMAKPVIAAAHGGLAETVADGLTGLLVPPGDAAALAQAIEQLIDLGPEGRGVMGRKGRDRVRRLYAKSVLQASTLQVYDRLLGARS
ncbi:MAG TPA: glycosyltransferase family 4 protein [Caulobacterales bacterium]|nr:glycosyltransferase family 4 protein [Caulobacterales bacterium]